MKKRFSASMTPPARNICPRLLPNRRSAFLRRRSGFQLQLFLSCFCSSPDFFSPPDTPGIVTPHIALQSNLLLLLWPHCLSPNPAPLRRDSRNNLPPLRRRLLTFPFSLPPLRTSASSPTATFFLIPSCLLARRAISLRISSSR